jgi:D-3-phosphoglycerate dehydrogenase
VLAERLGRFQAQLIDEAVLEVRIEYAGEMGEVDAAPVTRAFLAGLLRDMSARVNAVNAFLIAEERGISVTASYKHAGVNEFTPAIRSSVVTTGGEQIVSGALFGVRSDGRITEINGFRIEAIPKGHMLVTRTRDVPGVIGRVGTCLGRHGVNIGQFHLGRQERGGEAMAIIEIDAQLGEPALTELRSYEEVISARQIELA